MSIAAIAVCNELTERLAKARSTIAELEKRIGEQRMCVGCGSTQTIEDIRKDHPAALACCPERKMLTLKEWRQRSDKFEQALTAERKRREDCEAERDSWKAAAENYFDRYVSEAAPLSTTEAENE